MKFDVTTTLAGVALFAFIYMIGKRSGVKDAQAVGGGQPGNAINTQAEWWTYAGTWN
jgi:hypothetical protein